MVAEQVRRAARLVDIERLLRRNPAGLTVRELAERLGMAPRTIQRDLIVLQSELGVPLMDAPGRRYKLMPGSTPIGAVRFTLHEARAIYLASRLLLRHSDESDPDGISALDKLADALPPPLWQQVEAAARQFRTKPSNRAFIERLRTLTEAWATSQTVRIEYRAQSRKPRETRLDPYLLEASPIGPGVYVIGYSSEHGAVRTFKVDRIQSVELTGDHFDPAAATSVLEQIKNAWGIVFGEDEFEIELEFAQSVADRVKETNWHPTQRLTELHDGRVRLEMKLPSLLEFVPWVRGWGPEVVVVKPPELRAEVAESLRLAAAQYS